MVSKGLILFSVLITFSVYAQQDSMITAQLDSVINHIQTEKAKLIYLKQGDVMVDSSFYRKASYTFNNKEVKIIAKDYSYQTVPASEFWGLVTDFGQCQRFYNGKKYIVWYPKAPYIYREYEASGRKINYYYSESLLSEVILITEENIKNIADPQTIDLLTAYLKTHNIKKSNDGGPSIPFSGSISDSSNDNSQFVDLLLLHLEILETILSALVKSPPR